MNFVKSIISDDQEASTSESDRDSSGGRAIPTTPPMPGEFGSGLKKETEILRDTASRAVKDLPSSLDVVLKSTVSMINKEALGLSSDGEPETPGANRALKSGRYSRFEAQLSAMQSDLNTFCVEPEDAADYGKWKLGFELGDYEDPIEGLIGEDGILEGAYSKAVGNCKGKTEAAVVYGEKGNVIELSKKSGVDEGEGESGTVDGDEKVGVEEVVVSNHDDVGWDELGDVGSGDERKPSASGGGGGSPKKEEIRKRLITV
ncbi:hypothetical protein SASPL_122767 [Salvia splendens]|uniref:Uncharacterized protein n=1 Tax=Salvia splendens TaxID=180675 RepID=A0A8X8XJV3_SALSN|nr:hypothetical protein SASPL_122767 [Salvia splendens]